MVTKWSWRRIYAKCSVRARKTTPSAKPGKTGRHFAKNGERITGASKGWGRIFQDRIVSIHQPHVRPIVRGKAKAKTEFGAKINISLLDGYARVDHFHWDAFNEGQDLQSQVERFRKLTGKYPELVQVDKIYLTRENRRFLKEKRIRYTGEPLIIQTLNFNSKRDIKRINYPYSAKKINFATNKSEKKCAFSIISPLLL
jgi:hypothetical protein